MEKNWFNDPEPQVTEEKVECSSCRTDSRIKCFHYPHGMKGINFCPVCGDKVER